MPQIKTIELSRLFHETYERLAPTEGYETRPDTKEFDPQSRNGRLMISTVAEIQNHLADLLLGLPSLQLAKSDYNLLSDRSKYIYNATKYIRQEIAEALGVSDAPPR